MDLAVLIVLLISLVACAAACVVIRNLIKAALTLAAMSAVLSVVMFVLRSPLAAAFELSVCAGLITVVFISAVNMSTIHTHQEDLELQKARRKRFLWLPVLMALLIVAMLAILLPQVHAELPHTQAVTASGVQNVLWDNRQVELLGLIVIILTGVSGVIVFFKEEHTQ